MSRRRRVIARFSRPGFLLMGVIVFMFTFQHDVPSIYMSVCDSRCRCMNRETYIHTYVHTYTDRQTNRERERERERYIHTYIHTYMHTYIHAYTETQTEIDI